MSLAEKKSHVLRVMEQLGLSSLADARIGDERHRGLSGGEKRRLSIGLELVAKPDVLILDEPVSFFGEWSFLAGPDIFTNCIDVWIGFRLRTQGRQCTSRLGTRPYQSNHSHCIHTSAQLAPIPYLRLRISPLWRSRFVFWTWRINTTRDARFSRISTLPTGVFHP